MDADGTAKQPYARSSPSPPPPPTPPAKALGARGSQAVWGVNAFSPSQSLGGARGSQAVWVCGFLSANISVHQRSGFLLSHCASSASILAAKMKSFSLKPPMACVVSSILRFRYPVICKSG